jgi:hypothetical protein
MDKHAHAHAHRYPSTQHRNKYSTNNNIQAKIMKQLRDVRKNKQQKRRE